MSESSVLTYLRARHCRPTSEWVRSQISSSTVPLNGNQGIEEQLYRRWLAQDWTEANFKSFSVPSLPANASMEILNLQKITLTDKYLLQLTAMVDISKPLDYNPQDDEEAGEESIFDENEDDDDETFTITKSKPGARKNARGGGRGRGRGAAKGKSAPNQQKFFGFGARMYQLALTDGHIDSIAIEYQAIPALTAQLLPGAKILLTGPFENRLGNFLLRDSNVTLIYNPSPPPGSLPAQGAALQSVLNRPAVAPPLAPVVNIRPNQMNSVSTSDLNVEDLLLDDFDFNDENTPPLGNAPAQPEIQAQPQPPSPTAQPVVAPANLPNATPMEMEEYWNAMLDDDAWENFD